MAPEAIDALDAPALSCAVSPRIASVIDLDGEAQSFALPRQSFSALNDPNRPPQFYPTEGMLQVCFMVLQALLKSRVALLRSRAAHVVLLRRGFRGARLARVCTSTRRARTRTGKPQAAGRVRARAAKRCQRDAGGVLSDANLPSLLKALLSATGSLVHPTGQRRRTAAMR